MPVTPFGTDPSPDVASASGPANRASAAGGVPQQAPSLGDKASSASDGSLHPTQFAAHPLLIAGLQASRSAGALSRIAAPGGWRHIIPYAMNVHQTPYGSLASALMSHGGYSEGDEEEQEDKKR